MNRNTVFPIRTISYVPWASQLGEGAKQRRRGCDDGAMEAAVEQARDNEDEVHLNSKADLKKW